MYKLYKFKIINFLFLIIVVALLGVRLNSQDTSKIRILIAKSSFGKAADGKISLEKVDAALNFACNLTEKFKLIPPPRVDSLIKQNNQKNQKLTPQLLIDSLDASRMYFIQTDLLANMLRVEISSLNPKTNKKSIGVGFATVHYFEKDNNTPVYDPALLEAVQRAMAVAENDSTLFYGADSLFFVRPCPTLVISGINFVDNPKMEEWELFYQKEIKSYFIIENIFDNAVKSDKYVCYDVASRDSIYRLFNLAIPENHRSTNEVELSCLENLKVDYFISGDFIRNEKGAELNLYLMSIKNKIAKLVKKVSCNIEEDKITVLKDKVKELTFDLLDVKVKE